MESYPFDYDKISDEEILEGLKIAIKWLKFIYLVIPSILALLILFFIMFLI